MCGGGAGGVEWISLDYLGALFARVSHGAAEQRACDVPAAIGPGDEEALNASTPTGVPASTSLRMQAFFCASLNSCAPRTRYGVHQQKCGLPFASKKRTNISQFWRVTASTRIARVTPAVYPTGSVTGEMNEPT